jgi:CRISPR-associated protein (TIGR03986 family)
MKGKISTRKTKKGFVAEIVGSPLQLIEFTIPESDNGKECEYEVVFGRISKISVAGENRPKKQGQPPVNNNQSGGGYNHRTHQGRPQQGIYHRQGEHTHETAKAPYNFIPLNKDVVSFDAPSDMDRYLGNRHSGHIELNIETLAPFFIRGTSTDPVQECNENPAFFSPGNYLKIPGSSLRGMLRQLVEIVSSGKFQCDDRQLFFRNIGDEFYRETMIDVENNCFPRARAGLLVKRGGRYFIQPSQVIQNSEHYRIDGRFNGATFSIPGITDGLQQFTFRRIFFTPVPPMDHPHTDAKGNPIQLRYALVAAVSETPQKDYCEGFLVISGKFATKKHMQWIINMPVTGNDIEIPEEVVKQYAEDNTREDKADLLKKLKEYSEVPCFYLTDGQGHINAFGHTGLFRHPYKYSVHQQLYPQLIDKQSVDCAEAVFGKLERWAGRVFFEDADLEPGQENVLMQETSPKILSSPKPTTFQHYLEADKGKSKHWGEQAALRGYKLYWHRDTQQQGDSHWSERRVIKDNQHTRIRPVNPHIRP